jgi:hypothetical protein
MVSVSFVYPSSPGEAIGFAYRLAIFMQCKEYASATNPKISPPLLIDSSEISLVILTS